VMVVTAATGQVGREVIRLLAGAGPVRAMVRDPVAAGDLAGAEVIAASFEDAAAMAAAMTGAENVFLAGRDSPDYVAGQERALAAALPPACAMSSSSPRWPRARTPRSS